MASVQVSGSQTATSGTTHTLASITYAGTYQLNVDTSNIGSSTETITLKTYTKLTSGGNYLLTNSTAFTGSQTITLKRLEPIAAPVSFRATLSQAGGTMRTYDWAIVKID